LTTSSTVKSPESYVDTSALISFLDKSDSYHFLFRRLFASPPKLVTSPLVIAEGQAWFLRRFDSNRALQFVAGLEEMRPLRVLMLGPKDLLQATNVLRRFHDQSLTLTDALGLHIMAERRIQSCWSTDFHLGLTGVKLAIHET
jgi:predicted nucleic acid-binding protein